MQLNQTTNYFCKDELLESVETGILYYIHSGRNAWHSTWITRYSAGCMHTTFASAREFVEKKRVQGSVFYIKQLPCLIVSSNKNKLYITEINSKKPLSGYSMQAITNVIPFGKKLVENYKNNYFYIGADLENIGLSFDVDSRFWKHKPSAKNSVLIFYSINNKIYKTEEIPKNLRCYKSISHGKQYFLDWQNVSLSLDSQPIKDIYNNYLLSVNNEIDTSY